MSKKIIFFIFYFPALLAWSITYGILIGILGSLLGAIQKYIISIKDAIARQKYAPLQTLESWYMAKMKSVSSNEEADKIKEKHAAGKLKLPSIISLALFDTFYLFAFLPFYIIYGVFKSPAVVFIDGIRFWKINILKQDLKEVYKEWGKY